MGTVLVAPFLRPANRVGDTPPLPYYLYVFYIPPISRIDLRRPHRYCLVGIGVMAVGVLYWAVWRIALPRVFGYELVPRKEKLEDGIVVTLVSFPPSSYLLLRDADWGCSSRAERWSRTPAGGT